jgi:uncharacterized delta-60 repeat protein
MKAVKLIFLLFILVVPKANFAQFGTLDTSFDSDGIVITSFNSFDATVQFLLIQPDKKILAGGTISKGGLNQFGLARYNSDGSLDESFGNLGKVISNYPELMLLSTMALQSDGKIVVAGNLFNSSFTISHFVLVRYDTNGLLDTTFGIDGRVITNLTDKLDKITSIIIQSDGKILASGTTSNDSNYSDFSIVRYNPDGTLDPSFGNNGITITSIRTWDFGYAMALQDDNKIVISGSTSNEFNPVFGPDYDFLVLKYDKYGVLDATFGNGGSVIIGTTEANEKALSVKVLPDGKIVIGGEHHIMKYSFMISQLLPNGNVDTSFGNNGIVLNELASQFIESVAKQTDGKFLITEYHGTGGCCSADIKLMRFLTDGNFDTTFGTNGIVTADFLNENNQANSIVVQDDGKILIGGVSGNQIHSDYGLARFNSELALSTPVNQIVNNTFFAYPNPINQSVNLDFNLKESQILDVDLFNINGVKVTNLLNNKQFPLGFTTQKLQLPETLSKGVYFLSISNGTLLSNIKIVK